MKLLETITPEAISALPSGDGQALGYSPTTGTLVRVPSAAAAVAGAPKGAVWQRKGRIIRDPACIAVNAECNVLYEANSLLLGLPASEPVFKLWYSGGNTGTEVGAGGSDGMHYAESRNGFENWVAHPTAVISGILRCSVVKHAGTYYIYSGPWMARYASTDGVTFGAAETLTLDGALLPWEASGLQNTCTWVEPDGTWRMMYEAAGATGNLWQIGLATSTNGVHWVRSASNPVLPAGDGMLSTSAPDVHKIGDWYWMWFHGVPSNASGATTTIPTDVFRARSRDLITWERTPRYPTFIRSTPDEGAGSVQGQVADVSLIEVGGRVFMFYEGCDGAVLTLRNSSLKCAVANCTLEQLTQSNEGDTGEVIARDKMGGRAIQESISIGNVTGDYYEKIAITTAPTDARGVTISHRGSLTALTVTSEWPCNANLVIGGGANYKAPIVIGSGAVLTTPVAGAIEFDGTNLYFTTAAGVRKTITAT